MKFLKNGKIFAVILLFTTFLLSSCGGMDFRDAPVPTAVPQAAMDSGYGEFDGKYDQNQSEREEMMTQDFAVSSPEMAPVAPDMPPGMVSGDEPVKDADQKIIKRADISAETKDLSEFERTVNAFLTSYGGYTENSSIYIYDSEKNLKNGSFTLRVPSENYESLKQDILASCNVLSQSDSAQNATTEYRDTEARLNTKKAEEKRLLEMVEKAEKIEDLILLEERLSNVRTDIELYESRLKNIDRLASFSTINVNITEVKEETVKELSGDDLFSKMKGSFNASINFLIRAFEAIVVLLSGLLLPLLIIAIPVVIIVLVIKNKNKHKKNNVEKGDLNEKDNYS